MDWMNALRCPRCKASGLTINAKPNGELLPERSEINCHQCGKRFPIRGHVLDLTQRGDSRLLTMAGLSNYLPMLPWGYENVWRPRSLTLLSGEPFLVEREINLLNKWLGAQSGELIIDLGSSTDLYTRGIGKPQRDATIVAVDMATGMLRAGREYARRDGVKNIAHVRVPAQRLPFADASIDALMCGGSLNEFRSMSEMLREARRVVKPNGRMFAMSLLQATSLAGRIGQWSAHLSGITFPTLDQFNATIVATGWRCEQLQVFGVVAFTLMKPNRTSQS
jgi:SAM-dependent methyltransferase